MPARPTNTVASRKCILPFHINDPCAGCMLETEMVRSAQYFKYWNGLIFPAADVLSASLYSSSLCVQQQKGHRSRPPRLVFLPPASHIFQSDHQLYFIRICSLYFMPQARYITCISLESINCPCFLECEQKNWATSINCLP